MKNATNRQPSNIVIRSRTNQGSDLTRVPPPGANQLPQVEESPLSTTPLLARPTMEQFNNLSRQRRGMTETLQFLICNMRTLPVEPRTVPPQSMSQFPKMQPIPIDRPGQKTGRFFWSFGFLLFFFNLQKRRGGAASPPLHRGKDVEERGSQRRSMLSFRETKGNASFECSLAGSCVACHYSEKEFDYYEYDGGNSSAKKSELDLYLEEPKFDRKHYANMDILVYWRDNHARYPVLSILARDLMSIPITTVASESAFSIGAKVLTKYRTSIRPENAQAVICSRNWLFGYEIESDDPSDEQLVVPLSKNLLASVSRESTTTNALEVAGTIP
ncbi:uncharacterized protein LOC143858706 [Tasmannia lanceolata]|uniref:uncharacterized protein LOC143858706 n=1 Tax=Tasmannia lanceolata TaxID=3420 RepID=UPI00406314B9